MESRFDARLLPAVLALALLAFGIPQTGDAVLWTMTGDSPMQLGAASPTSADEARHNAELLEWADDWFGDPDARMRAGIIRLRLTLAQPDKAIDPTELSRASADLASGLGRAPANLIAWVAMAETQLIAGDFSRAKKALSASLVLDEHNPSLGLWRSAIGFALWDRLDIDDRRLLNEQVVMAWDAAPKGLLALAHQGGDSYTEYIRAALSADRRLLGDFDWMFQGH